ncbi:hypothetical protein, partial [Turicimonas muris]|uniref:hypothetical protein n=4 Tax=Turicimonas muris TaxID=1796652 RepID=UPI002624AA8B
SACRLLSEVFGSKFTLSGVRHICLWNFCFKETCKNLLWTLAILISVRQKLKCFVGSSFFFSANVRLRSKKDFLCFKFGAKWFASIWFQYLKEFLQKNPKRRKALLSQGFADFSQVLEKLD